MIDGETRTFLENLHYEDCWARFKDRDLFFNGCQCELDSAGTVISARLEVYDETASKVLLSVERPTQEECINALLAAPIFDGLTFWDVEQELRWTDGPEAGRDQSKDDRERSEIR